jgi:hypothetical protein
VNLGGFTHARTRPQDCSAWLTSHADLWGTTITVAHHDDTITVFEATMAPPPEAPDYPTETVRITIRANGEIYAVPTGRAARTWEHRYPRATLTQLARPISDWNLILGSLCLWYPRDPAHLQWHWDLGLVAYLDLVQKHLWTEEYLRRHPEEGWLGEDAPHGHRPDGQAHPIRTPSLRYSA